ncbi:molecular chaperone TorD family protein [bacterium]|nr:molecular chaperone TorD family protein [bacterium]MCI0607027.1 molecular chaperone TorD family protein [bacterium]
MKSNVKKTIQHAAEWRLASLLLSRPGANWHGEVRSLARESLNKDLQKAATEALSHASEEDYLALLGPAGHISPREIAYIGLEDPGLVIADLMNFYDAFHYEPHAEDPNDHIAVQTGFAGFLALKKAYAISTNNQEAHRITRVALKHFLGKHLTRMIRGMASNLTGCEPKYLRNVMRYLMRCVSHVPLLPIQKAPQLTEETIRCGL